MFRITNDHLGRNIVMKLAFTFSSKCCTSFGLYFSDKLKKLIASLSSNTSYYTETYNIYSRLSYFVIPSVDIILGLFNSSRSVSPNGHIPLYTFHKIYVPLNHHILLLLLKHYPRHSYLVFHEGIHYNTIEK